MIAEVILFVWNILALIFIFSWGWRQCQTEEHTTIKRHKQSFNKVQKEINSAAGFVHVESDHFVISCCDTERWTFVVKQTGSKVQQEARPEEVLFSGAPPLTAVSIQQNICEINI